jgi:hypothetical protein
MVEVKQWLYVYMSDGIGKGTSSPNRSQGLLTVRTCIVVGQIPADSEMTSIVQSPILEGPPIQRIPERIIVLLAHDVFDVWGLEEIPELFLDDPRQAMVEVLTFAWTEMQR